MKTIIEDEELEHTAEEIGSAAESVKRASATAGERIAEGMERKVATLGERVKGMGRQAVRERQLGLAVKVRAFEKAGQDMADDLVGSAPQPMVAGAEALAQTSGRVAGYLETREVDEMLEDAAKVTRRHPEVVLGGLLLAGFAAGRFLKASEDAGRRRIEAEDLS